jgi:alpha-1,6-mannosyltransferase
VPTPYARVSNGPIESHAMIKTLHITNAWHASSGGIRTWYLAALDAANREGRRLRLVVPDESDGVDEVGRFGRIYRVRAHRAPLDSRYRLLLPHRYILPAARLRRILREEQPDLLEICDKYTINWLAGLIRKNRLPDVSRPVLVGLSCERADDSFAAYLSGGPGLRQLASTYCRWCYLPFFDYHLAVSDYVAEELQAAMPSRHQRPVLLAPPGVNAARFGTSHRSGPLRRELLASCGASSNDVLLLYAGRLSPEKNIALLVDVLERLGQEPGADMDRYCLVLAGDGPLAPRLREEAAARTGGRLRVLGHVGDPADLARLYASCDVFVHPNAREPFGIGPLEAMASGRPVVLPNSGGVLTYANQANAWLADPTPDAFAAAVRAAAIDGPERRDRLARALDTVRAHSSEAAVERVFGLYDRMHTDFWRDRPVRGRRERVPLGAAAS